MFRLNPVGLLRGHQKRRDNSWQDLDPASLREHLFGHIITELSVQWNHHKGLQVSSGINKGVFIMTEGPLPGYL